MGLTGLLWAGALLLSRPSAADGFELVFNSLRSGGDSVCHTWEAKLNMIRSIITKQSSRNIFYLARLPDAHFFCCLMLLPSSGCASAGFFPGRRWTWRSLLLLFLFVFLRSLFASWAAGGSASQLTVWLSVFCEVNAMSFSFDFFAWHINTSQKNWS